MAVATELTPMLRHYLELKARHPDALLFYRMGDFFELFFDDAREAAPLLELTLTARQKGTENEAPMCGIPHHALEGYLARLLRLGRKVAICDQVEDPATAKGLVRREITRILTPGTLSETTLLDGKEENFLGVVHFTESGGAGAFLEVSTGRFYVRRFRDGAEAIGELELARPRELLLDAGRVPPEVAAWAEREVVCRTPLAERLPSPRAAAEKLGRQLGVATLRGFGLEEGEPAVAAAAAALAYAQDNQLSDLAHVRVLELREAADRLVVDATTLANLEVFRPLREGSRGASLIGVVDRTSTAAGGRAVRDWLRRPLVDVRPVADRQDAIAVFAGDPPRHLRTRERLAGVPDFERLASRAVVGTLTPREAAALRDGLAVAAPLLADLAGTASRLLDGAAGTDAVPELAELLAARLAAAPSASLQDGGVIAPGFDPELDEARSLAQDSKRHILAVEERERRAHRHLLAQDPLQPGLRLLRSRSAAPTPARCRPTTCGGRPWSTPSGT